MKASTIRAQHSGGWVGGRGGGDIGEHRASSRLPFSKPPSTAPPFPPPLDSGFHHGGGRHYLSDFARSSIHYAQHE